MFLFKKKNLWQSRLLHIFLAVTLGLSLTGFTWYSTTGFKSMPTSTAGPFPSPIETGWSLLDDPAGTGSARAQISITQTEILTPFIDITPLPDGTAIYISAAGIEKSEEGELIVANVNIGPGHTRGSYAMAFSDTIKSYVAKAIGFAPTANTTATLNITTTHGGETDEVEFNRAYLPAATIGTIHSLDGYLDLTLVSSDTFLSEVYITLVSNNTPPAPAPTDHRFIGPSYSIRASNSRLTTDEAVLLEFHYDEALLAGADPQTLAIFGWDPFKQLWCHLGGERSTTQQTVSLTTRRLATYALMSMPSGWYDNFCHDRLLSTLQGVSIGEAGIVLAGGVISGWIVSQPITPTVAFERWDKLVFSTTTGVPTTALTIDLLNFDEEPVLTNLTSGADLSSLDAANYPALKMRATLTRQTPSEATPVLHIWQISWEPEQPLLAPLIAGIWPERITNQLTATVTITGANFVSPTQIRLGDSFTLTTVTVVDGQSLAVVVPPGLPPGRYDITVINPDGQQATLFDSFEIIKEITLYLPFIRGGG